jgi:hypothetical protein
MLHNHFYSESNPFFTSDIDIFIVSDPTDPTCVPSYYVTKFLESIGVSIYSPAVLTSTAITIPRGYPNR